MHLNAQDTPSDIYGAVSDVSRPLVYKLNQATMQRSTFEGLELLLVWALAHLQGAIKAELELHEAQTAAGLPESEHTHDVQAVEVVEEVVALVVNSTEVNENSDFIPNLDLVPLAEQDVVLEVVAVDPMLDTPAEEALAAEAEAVPVEAIVDVVAEVVTEAGAEVAIEVVAAAVTEPVVEAAVEPTEEELLADLATNVAELNAEAAQVVDSVQAIAKRINKPK